MPHGSHNTKLRIRKITWRKLPHYHKRLFPTLTCSFFVVLMRDSSFDAVSASSSTSSLLTRLGASILEIYFAGLFG